MSTFMKYYDKLEEYALILSLALSVFLVSLQIIARYFINFSIPWSEELCRYLFIWQVWLGTSYAQKGEKHLKVEVFYSLIRPGGRKLIKIISDIIFLACSLFLTCNGFSLVTTLAHRSSLSPAMEIPMYWVYLSLPISSLMLSLRIFINIKNSISVPIEAFADKKGETR